MKRAPTFGVDGGRLRGARRSALHGEIHASQGLTVSSLLFEGDLTE